MTTRPDRYRGCLLGGAVGDALGAGIEFSSLADIHAEHGPAGVTGYVPCYGRPSAITDDTQMTLFTAEGLLRAYRDDAGRRDVPASLWRAYQRWLLTQGGTAARAISADGWLISQDFLHHERSPGMTCLSALAGGLPGTVSRPVNGSKGCGGVMRVGPAGLAATESFTLGCQAAALTHGHPSGYLAAGALAQMISELIRGRGLADAVTAAISKVQGAGGGAEVTGALSAAVSAAASGPPSTEVMTGLGEGWVAEEAIAVATYCALTARDFRSGVLLAVNHGGDSDSTGAICGNLLGAYLGAGAIDADLLDGLEGRDAIIQIADDLRDVFANGEEPSADRYPADPAPAGDKPRNRLGDRGNDHLRQHIAIWLEVVSLERVLELREMVRGDTGCCAHQSTSRRSNGQNLASRRRTGALGRRYRRSAGPGCSGRSR